jgi:hypothetical protein
MSNNNDMSKTVRPPIDFDADFDAPVPAEKPLHARSTDPETAHEGAERGNENFATVQDKILDELRPVAPEGLTTEELSDRTNIKLVSVSPMMKPMEKRDLVKRQVVGETAKGKPSYRKRKNRSGVSAIIWYSVKDK